MLERNLGTADRLIRLAIGVALLIFFFVGDGTSRWLGLIGLVPLLTSAVGSCPLYSLLGISTCPRKRPA